MLTPIFTTPMWIQSGVILRFGLVLCTKHEHAFTNKRTALKLAGALFRDGETPKWHVQVNKQVKRGCPGLVMQDLVGLLAAAVPAVRGWDRRQWKIILLKVQLMSYSLLLSFYLLSLSSLLSSRVPCKGGIWIMRCKASPGAGGARKLLWAPQKW